MTPRQSALGAAGLMGVAALAKVPTLGQPLTEVFAWRQTQTAWTARIFAEEGIDLFHPQVPVHGPPWTLAFEFPLFQAAGAVLMRIGFPPDLAMRVLGLACFLLTGWLIWRVLSHVAGSVTAVAALGAFLFSPFGLLWGRTSLIEYLATASALGFLSFGIAWLEGRRWALVGALALGSTAMLVKITTGAFYLLPLLAYRTPDGRYGAQRPATWGLIAASSAVGLAWTAYADWLKSQSRATEFLTSRTLIEWNFGTLAMRLEGEVWIRITVTIVLGVGAFAVLVCLPAAVAAVRSSGQRLFLGALAGAVVLGPPVILTPLYYSQDYYPAAISPAVAVLVGLGVGWLWAHRDVATGRIGIAAVTLIWITSLLLTKDYWLLSYQGVVDPDGSLAAARYIGGRTDPTDWVVVDGRLWDPTVLYYADRRGYMVDGRRNDPGELARLRADERYALFVDCPYQAPCRTPQE